MKTVPSVARLNKIGMAVEESVSKCEACFQKQLSLSPNSVQTLRRYAQFLLEIANNPSKAYQIVQQADEVEDNVSREHKDVSSAIIIYQPVSLCATVPVCSQLLLLLFQAVSLVFSNIVISQSAALDASREDVSAVVLT